MRKRWKPRNEAADERDWHIIPTVKSHDAMGLGEPRHERIAFLGKGCDTALRKHPGLEGSIARTVESQLDNGLFKSKTATTMRWNGLLVRECRVNAGTAGAFRAVFVADGGNATVVYVSRTLQKRAFTAELERFLAKRP